ncbi:MAG: DUF5665 domain-containing protein [Candidatus Saccharibacteria bacterium]
MIKKIIAKVKKDNEIGARRNLIEELFYDFHRSRKEIYVMNFFRGIFFGFGTVLGGTLLIALTVWILGQFVDWFPFIGDFIKQIIDAMQRSH